MLTQRDIEQAFERLGLAGTRAVIHSSVRSLGPVEGRASAVAAAVAATFETPLLPAFTFASNAPPPETDRPLQNGCDYAFYNTWNARSVPFRVEDAGIDRSMGALPHCFASLDGVIRSDHPWHSWLGRGPGAAHLLDPHPWDTTNVPLDRLAAEPSFVVMIGVGLTACTAIHVAEERAGRRPFVRWAFDRDGAVRRMRAAGCSKGFSALERYADGLFTEATIGSSRVRIAPLQELIERFAGVIRRQPEITVCSPTCLRCRDSVSGGPVE